MKRIWAVLLALLVAGCSDRAQPTGITATGQGAALQLTPASVGGVPGALVSVEDALNRVFAELPHGPAHVALGAALTALGEALEAENSCAIRTSRRDAEHALRDLSRRQPAEFDADFEAVNLALGSVEQPGKGKC